MTTRRTITVAAWAIWAATAATTARAESDEADADAGYVPAGPTSNLALAGYLDLGFADAQGDGTSFSPADHRLPVDYGTDPFATAVNSRGDVASIDSGGRFTNGFLPRTVGIGGRPSFMLNTLSFDVREGAPTGPLLAFARVQLLPRLDKNGSATQVIVDQAFGRFTPFASQELMLFLGKFDSVFGIEYLDREANLRTGITPSLFARYTTGPSIGAKVFFRHQIAPLWSAVSLNVAATNSAPFIEVLQASDISLTGRPVLSARLGYELNLPAFELKLGGSGLDGPRNDQSSSDAHQRAWAGDARLYAFGLTLAGEYVHLDEDQGPATDKLTGSGQHTFASEFHARGFWAQLTAQLPFAGGPFRRTFVYARGEQRRAWFEGFARVRVRRLTVGVHFDLGDSVALKAEWLVNREGEGAPEVPNDVRTASLVWSF